MWNSIHYRFSIAHVILINNVFVKSNEAEFLLFNDKSTTNLKSFPLVTIIIQMISVLMVFKF